MVYSELIFLKIIIIYFVQLIVFKITTTYYM